MLSSDFFLTNQTKLCTNVVKHTAIINICIFYYNLFHYKSLLCIYYVHFIIPL